jgi:hypothetical protein
VGWSAALIVVAAIVAGLFAILRRKARAGRNAEVPFRAVSLALTSYWGTLTTLSRLHVWQRTLMVPRSGPTPRTMSLVEWQ